MWTLLRTTILFWCGTAVISWQMAATLVTSVGSKCTRAHTQRWEVRGFSQLPSAVGAVKLSPTFTAFDREWHISVYPGGVAETNKGDVGVFLHLAKGNKLVLVSEVAIINQANSRTSAVPVASHEFSPDAVGWGLAKFLGRTTLLDETKGFVLNDVITFEVKLLAPAESKDLESVTTDLTLLSRATAELLASGLHSDVTLVVDGTTEIVAHKAILAARSPVFRAMFAHKMQETLEGRVLIDDMPPATMHSLLKSVALSSLYSCVTLFSLLFLTQIPLHGRAFNHAWQEQSKRHQQLKFLFILSHA